MNKIDGLTLKELCTILGRSEATLKNWNRTKATLEKRGIVIEKYKDENNDKRYSIEYR